jgi:uncharacterized coiled-coil DUF342 family protein
VIGGNIVDFTESERHAIEDAYRKMEAGEDITTDEMQLVIRFTERNTKREAEQSAKIKAIEDETTAKIAEAHKTEEVARQNLKALSDAAVQYYERITANV